MATLEERKAKIREASKLYKQKERARKKARKAKEDDRILHLRANYSQTRPRADDDELAYFRSQGARNASLHESSSSDDDDSLPRRSRSRERPAPRPSEVIVID